MHAANHQAANWRKVVPSLNKKTHHPAKLIKQTWKKGSSRSISKAKHPLRNPLLGDKLELDNSFKSALQLVERQNPWGRKSFPNCTITHGPGTCKLLRTSWNGKRPRSVTHTHSRFTHEEPTSRCSNRRCCIRFCGVNLTTTPDYSGTRRPTIRAHVRHGDIKFGKAIRDLLHLEDRQVHNCGTAISPWTWQSELGLVALIPPRIDLGRATLKSRRPELVRLVWTHDPLISATLLSLLRHGKCMWQAVRCCTHSLACSAFFVCLFCSFFLAGTSFEFFGLIPGCFCVFVLFPIWSPEQFPSYINEREPRNGGPTNKKNHVTITRNEDQEAASQPPSWNSISLTFKPATCFRKNAIRDATSPPSPLSKASRISQRSTCSILFSTTWVSLSPHSASSQKGLCTRCSLPASVRAQWVSNSTHQTSHLHARHEQTPVSIACELITLRSSCIVVDTNATTWCESYRFCTRHQVFEGSTSSNWDVARAKLKRLARVMSTSKHAIPPDVPIVRPGKSFENDREVTEAS